MLRGVGGEEGGGAPRQTTLEINRAMGDVVLRLWRSTTHLLYPSLGSTSVGTASAWEPVASYPGVCTRIFAHAHRAGGAYVRTVTEMHGIGSLAGIGTSSLASIGINH